MTSNDLSYLNGYLEVVATLNTFCNDGKTYTISLVDKNIDINTSLQKYYKVTASRFNAKSMGCNWYDTLTAELKPYFCQMLTKDKIKLTSEFEDNTDTVLRDFVLMIRKLIGAVELFQIDVIWDVQQEGFFECYSNDYIFDLEDKYLYLHLGSSD